MPFVAVVDTNIWVSAFIKPHGYPARLREHWRANRFDVVTCAELLTELAEVLTRPRLQTNTNVFRYALRSMQYAPCNTQHESL